MRLKKKLFEILKNKLRSEVAEKKSNVSVRNKSKLGRRRRVYKIDFFQIIFEWRGLRQDILRFP